MANHAALETTTNYAKLLTLINDRMYDQARGFEPTAAPTTNLPVNAIRWNATVKRDQLWNGTAWVDKTDVYSISINGAAASAAVLTTPRNINGVAFNGSAAISINLNNALTFSNAGDGQAPGATFNGGAVRTLSYNSIGAPSAGGAGASGTWGISISGNAATVTGGVYLTGDQSIAGVKSFTSVTRFANGAAGAPSISFGGDDDTGMYWGGANQISFTCGGTKVGDMTAGGHLVMVGNVTSYSDERLKTAWQPLIKDVCGRVSTILSGTYTRIDTKERQVGVSAQSLEEVIPEAVHTDENGIKSVAYGPAALAIVIEMAKEIVELRKRLVALESK